MSTTQIMGNKAIFMCFHDAVNTGDLDLISKAIDELADPDVLLNQRLPVESTGAEGLKQVMAMLLQIFPDLHLTVADVIAEGDKVVGRNVASGTQRGESLGIPPTGKRIAYNEIFIFRFVNARIAEMWGVIDMFSVIQQLGASVRGPS